MSDTPDLPYNPAAKFTFNEVEVLYSPQRSIVGLPDSSLCDVGIYEVNKKRLGFLWACPNNAAGFEPFPSAGADGKNAELMWQMNIIQDNIIAGDQQIDFNAVKWFEEQLETYSNTLGVNLYRTPNKMKWDTIYSHSLAL